MATRSYIGIENDDGTVRCIYAHWDGYPTWNGRILAEHYSDPVKLNALLDQGDVSVLAPEIGSKHPFDQRPENECTFYARDRAETGVDARTYKHRRSFLSRCKEDYTYLLTKDGWLFRHWDGGLRPLTPADYIKEES